MCDGNRGKAALDEPVVVMVSVLVVEFAPGVNELEEKLQLVFVGRVPQLSFTALENVPPSEETVSV